ncbi:MAG: hypothetical protein WC584_05455 [Candidatus Pacearchaeota archaeon]
MGMIRGGLLFFAGLLLLVSLIIGNILLTMGMSLSYENAKVGLTDSIKKNTNINFNQEISSMQIYCQSNQEYVLNSNLYNLGSVSIPCDVVAQGQDSVVNFVIGKYIETNYYKEYQCNLFDCPLESVAPFVYVSQHAKNYWNQWFYYDLFASLILIGIMFLLIEKKRSIFVNVGTLMIISSLPLLALNWLVSSFNFADVLFSKVKLVFWVVFIIGLILISIGIAFRFWGFFEGGDEETSKKEIKEIVEEEVSKVKEKISKSKNK